MVKIRLRRMGNKHRPFYRIVVAKSTAGRDGSFIDVLGTYDPVAQPKKIALDGPKSLKWLLDGAQPTETVAILMKKEGILDEFLGQRPAAKKSYRFLDKRTSAMSRKSVVEAVVAEPAKEEPKVEDAPAEEAVAEAPAVEPVAEEPTAEPEVAEPVAEAAEETATPEEETAQ